LPLDQNLFLIGKTKPYKIFATLDILDVRNTVVN
jgi:hypothetical protein